MIATRMTAMWGAAESKIPCRIKVARIKKTVTKEQQKDPAEDSTHARQSAPQRGKGPDFFDRRRRNDKRKRRGGHETRNNQQASPDE